jgi:hypothetical protein
VRYVFQLLPPLCMRAKIIISQMFPTLKVRLLLSVCSVPLMQRSTDVRSRLDPVVAARARRRVSSVREGDAPQEHGQVPGDRVRQQRRRRGNREPVRARSALSDAAELRQEFGSVEEVAKARGVSMAQVSLAWILAKDGESRPQMHWKEGC